MTSPSGSSKQASNVVTELPVDTVGPADASATLMDDPAEPAHTKVKVSVHVQTADLERELREKTEENIQQKETIEKLQRMLDEASPNAPSLTFGTDHRA